MLRGGAACKAWSPTVMIHFRVRADSIAISGRIYEHVEHCLHRIHQSAVEPLHTIAFDSLEATGSLDSSEAFPRIEAVLTFSNNSHRHDTIAS
jgi:hypothetical protein